MTRAVFLDRDGVINRATIRDGKPYPPQTVKDTEILDGVAEGMEMLKRAGFALAVVTNQPDVARGKQSREAVEAINNYLCSQLPLDHIEVCYHDDDENCSCRKPKPGLITLTSKALKVDPLKGFLVGDRWKDIAAGRAAGCRTIWIDAGYNETKPTSFDFRTDSLLHAAEWIIRQA
ncbi:MAG: D-glycero-alpha-D-manno-heptose-1,7-bisphosphate 7-phosphatase [Rhodospirillaceae bacterium]